MFARRASSSAETLNIKNWNGTTKSSNCASDTYQSNFLKASTVSIADGRTLHQLQIQVQIWPSIPLQSSGQMDKSQNKNKTAQYPAQIQQGHTGTGCRYIPGLESAILSSVMAQKIHF